MKPSPYFNDRFRYFFKRFYGKERLFRWFLAQAGEESGAFNFPAALKGNPKTLIFLHRDMERAAPFMHGMPESFFKNALLCAHDSLQALISAKRAHAVYYSDLECRYGTAEFQLMEEKIKAFAPQVIIYLGEAFLPRLYLAKISGASCRIGFGTEQCYPFLNLSLQPSASSEAALISEYYGVR